MFGRRRRRRRQQVVVIGLVVLLASLVAFAYMPAPALHASFRAGVTQDDPAALPWLHAKAGRILDARGRAVLLRGFNVGALVAYPAHPSAPLDERDAVLMQQAGFDLVRLGIDWSQLEPVRGQIDDGYLARVVSTVTMLNRHGLYVVLDMHFRLGWSPRFGYSGAPAWATLPVIPNFDPLPAFSWGPALSPAAWTAETYFWIASDWQAELQRVWRAVAERFRAMPGIAGYDLFNEPHPLPIPPRIFENYFLWPFYQRSIESVAEVDPNHIFFLEGILLFTLDTAVRAMVAPNLVYADHVYEGSLVPPFWNGDPKPLQDRFRQRLREARALSAPWLVGELGYDVTKPEAGAYADAALDDADDLAVGWAWWQWRENRYWGIRDAAGSSLNIAFLQHLARPYLQAAPSGVTAGRGDGQAGRLQVAVDAAHGLGSVVVGWSSLTLRRPAVSGSCVAGSAWDAAAARLTINLMPDSGCRVELVAE